MEGLFSVRWYFSEKPTFFAKMCQNKKYTFWCSVPCIRENDKKHNLVTNFSAMFETLVIDINWWKTEKVTDHSKTHLLDKLRIRK